MLEDFINALNNFKTNKLRTLLSLLGIVIGVFSVVIITTLGYSMQKSMEEKFKRFNMNVLTMWVGWDNRAGKQAFKLDDTVRQKILDEIPEIKNIFFSYQNRGFISRNNIIGGDMTVQGVEIYQLETLEFEIDYGNFFEPTDYVSGSNKIVIGKQIAENLFPEGNSIGKTINLKIGQGNYSRIYILEIAGVLKNKMTWFMNSSQTIYIPRNTFNKIYNTERQMISNAQIVTHNANDAPLVKEKMEAFGKKLAPKVYQPVWVQSVKSQLEDMNKIMSMVRLVISVIAGISLLVGGIGIMNIMLVTVTERRKEIGIRKALGATNRAIRIQFLVESATLTLTGGIIGVAIGLLLSKVLVNFVFPAEAEMLFFVDIKGSIIAFAVSVFIGIFFGLHPASKAAKLDPVVALGD